jgi:hypothetical protein
MSKKGRKLFRVRLKKDDGRFIVFLVKARSSDEAANQRRSKGRIISVLKAS